MILKKKQPESELAFFQLFAQRTEKNLPIENLIRTFFSSPFKITPGFSAVG